MLSLRRLTLATALAAILGVASLAAQRGVGGPINGFSGGTSHAIQFNIAVEQEMLGCAFDGTFFYTTGPYDRVTPKLYKWDLAGNLVASWNQPAGVALPYGIRDIAYDEQTKMVYGAAANKTVFVFDPAANGGAGAFTTTPITLTPTMGGGQNARAIAIGTKLINGVCTKVFVVKDWNTPVSYYDFATGMQAAPDTPNPTGTVSTYGAAFDPVRRTVWFNNQGGGSNPNNNRVVLTEIDIDTGLPTGQMLAGDISLGTGYSMVYAGGLDFYVDASGQPVLAYITQIDDVGIKDWLALMGGRFQYSTNGPNDPCGRALGNCGGKIAFTSEPYAGNPTWSVDLSGAPANATAAFLAFERPDPVGFNFSAGLQNCDLYIRFPFFSVAAPPLSNGATSMTIPIPPTAAGFQIAFQWLVVPQSVLPLDLSDAGFVYVHQ